MAKRVLREARNWSNGRRGTVTARAMGRPCCVRHIVNVEDRKEGETRKDWIMMAFGKAAITRVCSMCEV